MYIDDTLVVLTPLATALLAGVCGYIALSGRIEVITAFFVSQLHWSFNVTVGPVAITWIFVVTMIASGFRNQQWSRVFATKNKSLLWLVAWLFWIVVLILAVPNELERNLLRNILVYIMLPVLAVLAFAPDPDRVRVFVYVFVGSTLLGGVINIIASSNFIGLDFSLSAMWANLPAFVRLNRFNYHSFATVFLVSASLCLGLLRRNHSGVVRIGLFGVLLFMVFVIFISGSRSTMVGLMAVVLVFWATSLGGRSRFRFFLSTGLAFVLIGLILGVYELAPAALRISESSSDQLGIVTRIDIWQDFWNLYLLSPIFGQGAVAYNLGHNLFLESLLVSGVPGFIFLIGFLIFTITAIKKFIVGHEIAPNAQMKENLLGPILAFIGLLVQTQFLGGLLGNYPLYWISFVVIAVTSGEGARFIYHTPSATAATHGSLV